jgi:HPr kinase/phosphorylase
MEKTLIHATTISINGTAVVIRGASGSGKSDLALQVLEMPATGLTGQTLDVALVSDDQTLIWLDGQNIMAAAPENIQGLLEVRGHGILQLQSVGPVPVVLIVDLKPAAAIERLPEMTDLSTILLGKNCPAITIDPGKVSAAARLRTAWAKLSKQ